MEIQAVGLARRPWAWLYYASFVVVAVFVVVNLFIAVVLNNLESARAEQRAAEDERHRHAGLLDQIRGLKDDLEQLEQMVRRSARG